MGGIAYIFLTHRDDVAEAEKFAQKFSARRIIHRLELSSQPGAEIVIDGEEPREIGPQFLVIPIPGHTRGHCCLLYDHKFLFTGDHLCWSRTKGRLNADRDVC
jgi:glyoxylase-like metal-dependent hydrolase (beta-lactamase superfamily II)